MNPKSIWEISSEYKTQFNSLNGEQSCDVVIIGGGITGVTAAYLLAEAGKKVILLEAREIGLGTTGNSTGNLYPTVDETLSTLRKKWGDETMQKVVDSRLAAINLIEKNVQQHSINCNFERCSFNYFADVSTDESRKFFRDELEAMQLAGLQASLVSNLAVPFAVEECLTLQNAAQFHPLDYVRGLASKMPASAMIYENSAVMDIDADGIVRTANGSVKAQAIIMATHTPKGVYMVQTVLGPYREHGVAAEFQGDFPSGIYWSYNDPKHSIRKLEKGTKKYIMAVGDKYKTGHGGNTNEYVAGIDNLLSAKFELSAERYTWGGQQYRPADGLPYIGKQSDRLFMATGFSTDGLVYGTLAAMLLSDEILGKENPWAETYKYKRFTPIKSFAEFFKENAENLMEYMKDVPWDVDAKNSRKLAAGEAAIIEHDGNKLAVYKDNTGQKHVCSAVCTHMKCIVNWNPAEKSWDCPCHGSRFNYEGKVIEGPAIVDLPKHPLKQE